MAHEAAVEVPITEWAKRAGWVARKLVYQGRRAAFDKLFYGFHRVVFIEFKDPDGELSELQKREWQRFKDAGVEAYVVDTLEEGCKILKLQWPRP